MATYSTSEVKNRDFKVVFTCNKRHAAGKYMRVAVGIHSLHKYIGVENANTAILKALESGEDKYTKKFRTLGRVEFYAK